MPYYVVENFSGGLDLRKSSYRSPPNTMRRLVNCHVTHGGEIEKRKAFPIWKTVAGTFGLSAINDKVFVFVPDAADAAIDEDATHGITLERCHITPPHGETFERQIFATNWRGKPVINMTTVESNSAFLYYDNNRISYHPDDPENPGVPGVGYFRPYQNKMYNYSNSNLQFSNIDHIETWKPVEGDADADPVVEAQTGSGFIDLSVTDDETHDQGAIEIYYDRLIVMTAETTQFWAVDPDPARYQLLQTLRSTGTVAFQSVRQFGGGDVLYWSREGIRSLRARNDSNVATKTDLGAPIDRLMVDILADASQEELERAVALEDYVTGRWWLIVGDKAIVLSQFPRTDVSAWSVYELGFTMQHAVQANGRIFIRDTNDNIRIYGGLTGEEYDGSTAVAQTPFVDAGEPAMHKKLVGFDFAGEGNWRVGAAYVPGNVLIPATDEIPGTPRVPAVPAIPGVPGRERVPAMAARFGVPGVGAVTGVAAEVTRRLFRNSDVEASRRWGIILPAFGIDDTMSVPSIVSQVNAAADAASAGFRILFPDGGNEFDGPGTADLTRPWNWVLEGGRDHVPMVPGTPAVPGIPGTAAEFTQTIFHADDVEASRRYNIILPYFSAGDSIQASTIESEFNAAAVAAGAPIRIDFPGLTLPSTTPAVAAEFRKAFYEPDEDGGSSGPLFRVFATTPGVAANGIIVGVFLNHLDQNETAITIQENVQGNARRWNIRLPLSSAGSGNTLLASAIVADVNTLANAGGFGWNVDFPDIPGNTLIDPPTFPFSTPNIWTLAGGADAVTVAGSDHEINPPALPLTRPWVWELAGGRDFTAALPGSPAVEHVRAEAIMPIFHSPRLRIYTTVTGTVRNGTVIILAYSAGGDNDVTILTQTPTVFRILLPQSYSTGSSAPRMTASLVTEINAAFVTAGLPFAVEFPDGETEIYIPTIGSNLNIYWWTLAGGTLTTPAEFTQPAFRYPRLRIREPAGIAGSNPNGTSFRVRYNDDTSVTAVAARVATPHPNLSYDIRLPHAWRGRPPDSTATFVTQANDAIAGLSSFGSDHYVVDFPDGETVFSTPSNDSPADYRWTLAGGVDPVAAVEPTPAVQARQADFTQRLFNPIDDNGDSPMLRVYAAETGPESNGIKVGIFFNTENQSVVQTTLHHQDVNPELRIFATTPGAAGNDIDVRVLPHDIFMNDLYAVSRGWGFNDPSPPPHRWTISLDIFATLDTPARVANFISFINTSADQQNAGFNIAFVNASYLAELPIPRGVGVEGRVDARPWNLAGGTDGVETIPAGPDTPAIPARAASFTQPIFASGGHWNIRIPNSSRGPANTIAAATFVSQANAAFTALGVGIAVSLPGGETTINPPVNDSLPTYHWSLSGGSATTPAEATRPMFDSSTTNQGPMLRVRATANGAAANGWRVGLFFNDVTTVTQTEVMQISPAGDAADSPRLTVYATETGPESNGIRVSVHFNEIDEQDINARLHHEPNNPRLRLYNTETGVDPGESNRIVVRAQHVPSATNRSVTFANGEYTLLLDPDLVLESAPAIEGWINWLNHDLGDDIVWRAEFVEPYQTGLTIPDVGIERAFVLVGGVDTVHGMDAMPAQPAVAAEHTQLMFDSSTTNQGPRVRLRATTPGAAGNAYQIGIFFNDVTTETETTILVVGTTQWTIRLPNASRGPGNTLLTADIVTQVNAAFAAINVGITIEFPDGETVVDPPINDSRETYGWTLVGGLDELFDVPATDEIPAIAPVPGVPGTPEVPAIPGTPARPARRSEGSEFETIGEFSDQTLTLGSVALDAYSPFIAFECTNSEEGPALISGLAFHYHEGRSA